METIKRCSRQGKDVEKFPQKWKTLSSNGKLYEKTGKVTHAKGKVSRKDVEKQKWKALSSNGKLYEKNGKVHTQKEKFPQMWKLMYGLKIEYSGYLRNNDLMR